MERNPMDSLPDGPPLVNPQPLLEHYDHEPRELDPLLDSEPVSRYACGANVFLLHPDGRLVQAQVMCRSPGCGYCGPYKREMDLSWVLRAGGMTQVYLGFYSRSDWQTVQRSENRRLKKSGETWGKAAATFPGEVVGVLSDRPLAGMRALTDQELEAFFRKPDYTRSPDTGFYLRFRPSGSWSRPEKKQTGIIRVDMRVPVKPETTMEYARVTGKPVNQMVVDGRWFHVQVRLKNAGEAMRWVEELQKYQEYKNVTGQGP